MLMIKSMIHFQVFLTNNILNQSEKVQEIDK